MDISVDLSVLLYPSQWEAILHQLPSKAEAAGVTVDNVAVEELYDACETDNVLVNEYWMRHGAAPTGAVVYRIIVNGSSTLPLNKALPQ